MISRRSELLQHAETTFGLPPATLTAVHWDDGDDQDQLKDREVRKLQAGERLAFIGAQISASSAKKSKTCGSVDNLSTLLASIGLEKDEPTMSIEEAMQCAEQAPLPSWRPVQPLTQRMPAVSVEDELRQLLQTAFADEFDVKLPQGLAQFKKAISKKRSSRGDEEPFRWAYTMSKPWRALASQIKTAVDTDESQLMKRWETAVARQAGSYLDECAMVKSEDGKTYHLRLVLSDLAWGSHMLQMNRPHDCIDSVVLSNIHVAIQRLDQCLEQCVLPEMRTLLRRAMQYIQKYLIRVPPWHSEYRQRVAALHSGPKGPRGSLWSLSAPRPSCTIARITNTQLRF